MAEFDMKRQVPTKQKRFIAALLQSGNAAAAGESSGVPERTFRRWLADDDFRAALEVAENELIEDAARRILSLQGAAVDELSNILSGRFPPALKLKAAVSVVDVSLKLLELRRLSERVSLLENRPSFIRVVYDDAGPVGDDDS